VSDGPEILQRACRLSIELNHHLFDTLYHAVALHTDSVLVTADAQYLNKAAKLGNIVSLADWVSAE
jgi:predicted nucleic acid-binding protein